MTPRILDLDPIVEGHTWDGLPTVIIKKYPQGDPPTAPASPLSKVEMLWTPATDCKGTPFLMTSDAEDPGKILIMDAAEAEFSIPSQILPLTKGKWRYLVTVIDSETPPRRDPILAGSMTVQ